LPEVKKIVFNLKLNVIEHYKQVFPFISINDSWDKYWDEIRKRPNNNIERSLKRALRKSSLVYGSTSEVYEYNNILDQYIEMHYKRWKSKNMQSKYQKQKHRGFLKSLTLELLKEEKLFIRYLAYDSVIIAIAICILDKEKLYYVWPTFNIDYRQIAPGKLLLYYILREAFQEGYKEVDLGPGGDEYKSLWATETRSITQIIVSRASWPIAVKYKIIPETRRMMKPILKRILKM
jgi:CelD/BcsL family acetyltransferase involved in cellulose biosynthesis